MQYSRFKKRLPKIIGPALAGIVIQATDPIAGMRILVVTSLCLAVFSLLVQWRWMPHRKPLLGGPSLWQIFRELHPRLRRLLVAEIFTGCANWVCSLFRGAVRGGGTRLVLQTLRIAGGDAEYYGVANVSADWPHDASRRFTALHRLDVCFLCAFPAVLAMSPPNGWLFAAFVVYGLRVGEPARKAMITNLMPEAVRARGVGLYWGLRSFALCTAPWVYAWIWGTYDAHTLLLTAFGLGCMVRPFFMSFAANEVPAVLAVLPFTAILSKYEQPPPRAKAQDRPENHMAFDPYDPCPCGSGKKFRWCCQPVYVQIDQAFQQEAQGQHEAALRIMEGLCKDHPGNPEVWGRTAQAAVRGEPCRGRRKRSAKGVRNQPQLSLRPLPAWPFSPLRGRDSGSAAAVPQGSGTL